jgi:hypothetical protein
MSFGPGAFQFGQGGRSAAQIKVFEIETSESGYCQFRIVLITIRIDLHVIRKVIAP